MTGNNMNRTELKTKLRELFEGNEEEAISALNEIWLEDWMEEEEKSELLTVSILEPEFVEALKTAIEKQLGQEYATNPTKLATLINVFVTVEAIEKGTGPEKIKELATNPKLLEGLKAVAKLYDKENGW